MIQLIMVLKNSIYRLYLYLPQYRERFTESDLQDLTGLGIWFMEFTKYCYPTSSKVDHNTNKFHEITKYPYVIRKFGAPLVAATYIDERQHIENVKLPFITCTNERDPMPQIIQ